MATQLQRGTHLATLRAEAGTAVLPGAEGPVTVPIWGFRDLSAPDGTARIPGPLLEVGEGDEVYVALTNALAEPVSIVFPGQEITPRPVKDASGRFISYTTPAEPGQGAVSYLFTAVRPGIYLYESGTRPEKQVLMGLFGALVVRPSGFNPGRASTRTAYGNPDTRFDVEQFLVLSEVDTRLAGAAAEGAPFDLASYNPDYWLINGRSYPDTLRPDDGTSQPLGAAITAGRGQRVLLRCVNAGFTAHSLCFGGLIGRIIGQDGYPLRNYVQDRSYRRTTLTIPAGGTCDVLLQPERPGEYIIYDRALRPALNQGAFPGGMISRLTVE